MFTRDRLVAGLLVACVVMFGMVTSIAARHTNHELPAQEAITQATADYATEAAHRSDDAVLERTFQVEAGQTLFLDTDLGKVTIEGTSGNEVHVRVTKASADRDVLRRFDVSFQQSGRGIDVEGRYDGPRFNRGRQLKVEYEITVPHDFHVEVETSGGSIELEDLRGTAMLRTSGGSITAQNVGGPVDAHTSGGSVTVENIGARALLKTSGGSINARDVEGPLEAKTSGGSITAERIHGNLAARTSGGSIRLEAIYGSADAQTSGGGITAELIGQPRQDMNLKTSGGSIVLYLDDEVRADIQAHASGGRVTTDLPLAVRGDIKRGHLEGTLNGGGPLLSLNTSGGGIQIK